jgi:prefoldin subunit 5
MPAGADSLAALTAQIKTLAEQVKYLQADIQALKTPGPVVQSNSRG